MKFCIPFIDQPSTFWNSLSAEYENLVDDVYFPFPDHFIPSGRPPQPKQYLQDFLEKTSISKCALINPIVLPETESPIVTLVLNELENLRRYYGINKVTVTDLSLARTIRRTFPDIEITASTLMRISRPEQIPLVEGYIDCLVPDSWICRDLDALRKLRNNFNGKIKLLVNEGCLPGCPFRTQHFYEMAYSKNWPKSLCRQSLAEKPWLRMQGAWILPQFLCFYNGLFDVIKLDGRVTLQDPDKYRKVLDAYCTSKPLQAYEIGVGPAGIDHVFYINNDVFYKLITCPKNCAACSFCRDYYDRNK